MAQLGNDNCDVERERILSQAADDLTPDRHAVRVDADKGGADGQSTQVLRIPARARRAALTSSSERTRAAMT